MNRFYLSILLVLLTASGARGACNPTIITDYTLSEWDNVLFVTDSIDSSYYDPDDDSVTVGGDDCECVDSLSEVNAWMTASTGSMLILFKNGDGFTMTSNNDRLLIKKPNVYVDTFGAGDKFYIDGNATYPTDQTMALVEIGKDAAVVTSNVKVNGLDLRNTHNGTDTSRIIGMGMWIAGPTGSSAGTPQHKAAGPIWISNCDIHGHGRACIQFSGVNNSTLAEATAVIFEYNNIYKAGEYWRAINTPGGKPQAINSNYGGNTVRGHIFRYNKLHDTFTEGLGGNAYSIIEYNEFYNFKAPAILYNGSASTSTNHRTARYNLFWQDTDSTVLEPAATYRNHGIRITNESTPSTAITHDFYGNIFAGLLAGIVFQHTYSPTGTWGTVNIYNNTFIDNDVNIKVQYPNYFTSVNIKNNASIIHSDAASTCAHVSLDGSATWSGWSWGPNFYYGDTTPGTPYYDTDDLADFAGSGEDPIPKTSGWQELTSIPSFADNIYPGASSPLVDSTKTIALGPPYNQYLTTGTIFNATPSSATWVRTDQEGEGLYWDFGAAIRAGTPVTYPVGAITVSGYTCPVEVDEGTAVTFLGGASGGSGSGYTYAWDFGGAAVSSTAQNPANTFSSVGAYTVSLTVTDGAGRADPTPATCGLTINDTGGAGGYTLAESFGGAWAGNHAFGKAISYLYVIAAKFTSAGVSNLGRYRIMLDAQGTPSGTLTAYIYNDDDGDVGTLVAGSGSVAVAAGSVPSTPGNVDFDITTPFNLGAGTYWLVLIPTQVGSDANYFQLGRDSTGAGIMRGESDFSLWTSPAGYDGIFELYSYEAGEEPTVPQVLSITTAEADGTYGDDDVISGPTVTLSTSGKFTAGVLRATLNVGDTPVTLDITDNFTGNTFTFPDYTVDAANNENTNDLDLVSIELVSGTFVDTETETVAVNLIIPTGSSNPGALAYGSDIVISTDNPTIVAIIPVSDDKTYSSTSDIIYFIARCGKPIYAVGLPYFAKIPIRLDYPAITLYAYYVSGSGSTDLLMQISGFQAGYRESDLDYYGEAPEIELDGGTLKDIADNDLVLTLPTTGRLADVANYVIAIPQGTGNTVSSLGFLTDNDTVSGTESSTFDLSAYYGAVGYEIDIVVDNWILASGSNVLGNYYRLTGKGITGDLTIGDNCTMTGIKGLDGTITVGSGCVLTRCGQ